MIIMFLWEKKSYFVFREWGTVFLWSRFTLYMQELVILLVLERQYWVLLANMFLLTYKYCVSIMLCESTVSVKYESRTRHHRRSTESAVTTFMQICYLLLLWHLCVEPDSWSEFLMYVNEVGEEWVRLESCIILSLFVFLLLCSFFLLLSKKHFVISL